MKSNPLISIIMPAKNAGIFLPECLDSIINQTYKNWELIVCNDHSTDNTLKILNQYQLKYADKIKVVQNNGNGIIDALNTAYNLSKGDFITRMDADDIMPLNKLKSLITPLLYSDKTLTTGYVKYFSENGISDGYKKYEKWLNSLVDNQSHFNELYKECVIPSPCWMISKGDFELCGAFRNDLYPEDYDLCFRFYENNIKVIGIKEVLHLWRDHQNRSSRTDENYKDNRFLKLKMHYFLKNDYHPKLPLYLISAGKKSKIIAKHLIEKNIPFKWLTNNPKKIGQNIYGKTIENISLIKTVSKAQCLVAIASPSEQKEVKKLLPHLTAYFVC
ncbi:MAG: glycosyltransferase [Vicingaceae bacterium]